MIRGSPAPAGIDPASVADGRFGGGLPRTRGDRPYRFGLTFAPQKAPPHPRGSTPRMINLGHRPQGSPAPAGIDPDPGGSGPDRKRLPRTRGDRPRATILFAISVQAPPHPRGSTLDEPELGAIVSGSPAPAGIDPRPRSAEGRSAGLPRTRGDRPTVARLERHARQAPPHPRGSTPLTTAPTTARFGSPAPAGIDLAREQLGFEPSGLPRTRGDRPSSMVFSPTAGRAPPHPRGSTLHRIEEFTEAGGSPAPAGIDLIHAPRKATCARLPRTRGDRPIRAQLETLIGTAPPHPRGSTRCLSHCERSLRGSPAPAGIDPSPRRIARPWNRLPRTRGDRPSMRRRAGDAWRAPPHPRGSTPPVRSWPHPATGSPAPAGIDPAGSKLAASGNRLPRTRGDRPDEPRLPWKRYVAPPHPRGSTLLPPIGSSSGDGSPAPAGIDPGHGGVAASP